MKILVVDDEPQICRLLKTGLTGYGFEVITATNGSEALTLAGQKKLDMIILDITLGSPPDGLEVCAQIRAWSNVPIIMLSIRSEEKTKVAALDAGADDYIVKPFGMEELRPASRRFAAPPQPSAQQKSGRAVCDDLVNRRVTVEGEEVHLTPKEYELLRLLAIHPGKVMTHKMLLSQVWGPDYAKMDNYIRVYVNQIRKKLRENPARDIRYIINETGVGYRFVDIE
jgi:two-component system KDP operon response regulator KdpE